MYSLTASISYCETRYGQNDADLHHEEVLGYMTKIGQLLNLEVEAAHFPEYLSEYHEMQSHKVFGYCYHLRGSYKNPMVLHHALNMLESYSNVLRYLLTEFRVEFVAGFGSVSETA